MKINDSGHTFCRLTLIHRVATVVVRVVNQFHIRVPDWQVPNLLEVPLAAEHLEFPVWVTRYI